MQVRRILIVHTFGIGDMIMFTPAMESLCRQFPAAEIDFLLGYPPVAEVIRSFPRTRRIFMMQKGIMLFWQILELRKKHYDYVLVTSGHNGLKSGLFTRLLAAKCTIGEYAGMVNFFNKAVKNERNRHRVTSNLLLANKIAEVHLAEQANPKMFTNGIASDEAARILTSLGRDGKIIIGVHCDCRANQSYKRWPLTHFCTLMTKINHAYPDSEFLLFCDKREDDGALILHSKLPHTSHIVYGQPLQVVAELIRYCQLMIANDSGLGHIASAVGTPTLSLFGPSDPVMYAPIGDYCKYIKVNNYCAPCHLDVVPLKCREMAECLAALTPDAVFEVFVEIMETTLGDDKVGFENDT